MIERSNMNSDERAVQKKMDRGAKLNSDDKAVVQARLGKMGMGGRGVQRIGSPLPAGAQIIPGANTSISADPVISMLTSVSGGMNTHTARPPNWASSDTAAQVRDIIESSNLGSRNVRIYQNSDAGINSLWTGNISFGISNRSAVPSTGTGTVNAKGGGGASSSSTQSHTETAGGEASVSGTAGQKDVASGTAGLKGSTSSSDTVGRGTGTTSTSEVAVGTTDNLERYTATLMAEVNLSAELRVEGSDYINPFKWGNYLGESMDPIPPGHGTCTVGQLTFQVSNGIAAPR